MNISDQLNNGKYSGYLLNHWIENTFWFIFIYDRTPNWL